VDTHYMPRCLSALSRNSIDVATENGVKIPTRTPDQDAIDSPRAVGHCRPMVRAGLHILADISVPDKNGSRLKRGE